MEKVELVGGQVVCPTGTTYETTRSCGVGKKFFWGGVVDPAGAVSTCPSPSESSWELPRNINFIFFHPGRCEIAIWGASVGLF